MTNVLDQEGTLVSNSTDSTTSTKKTDKYTPTGFALEIFQKRYALHPEETWEEACRRVASHVSMAERDDKKEEIRKEFLSILDENLFMPAGRIWYGSGRLKGNLMNCYVGSTEDSREGWGETVKDMIIICGTGGGLGVNCSPIRPRGTPINGSGGIATGAVSLMEILNSAGEVIKAGGGRRTALMLALDINHGDIKEFLDAKLDLNKLNNANVSVVFNENPEEFFEKVRNDEQFDLIFRGAPVGSIPARDLWDKIIINSLKSGEPGILNSYLANKMSNVWYIGKFDCTNPCAEQWLLDKSCCCLGSVVLPRFVRNGKIDWASLKATVKISVRFLDNVLSVNNYPMQSISETAKSLRNIGLGVMGLHDTLLMLGLRYNSDEGLELVDKILKVIKHEAYEASVELAIEKGPFPKFNPADFIRSGFVKSLKPSIRTKIKEHGIRNCALLTIAPTGTTSMVCNVTSGVEAMFAPAYLRRYYNGDERAEEVVVHPLFREYVRKGKDVSHFQGSQDLTIRDHLEMQRTCQRHIDSSISKTIQLPPKTSAKELSDLLMEFFPDLKGVTVYPEGSRENQPLTPLPLKRALKLAKQETAEQSFALDTCKDGKCDL